MKTTSRTPPGNCQSANIRQSPCPTAKARGPSPFVVILMAGLIGVGTSRFPVAGAFTDANWIRLNPGVPGVDNSVYATARDGAGNLYVGGDFAVAGTVVASRVAKWDGTNWSALGLGLDGTVRALAVAADGMLYAGGTFTNAGGGAARYIARWDGTNWTALGSGLNGTVRALVVSGGNLYVGGEFTAAGSTTLNCIGRWDGNTWWPLGTGMNRAVVALAASGGNVYAGGSFWTAGGGAAYSIAKWNGGAWSALGSGLGLNTVYALAVSGNLVYAASGSFPGKVDRWNGSSWSTVGTMNGGVVYALALHGTDLIVGGDGYVAVEGGGTTYAVARWSSSANTWSPLGSGLKNGGLPVYALAMAANDVYAGGRFSEVGGTATMNIARWNWTSWFALGSGMDRGVSALAVAGTNLYAGGYFIAANGGATNRLARWNGSGWSPLGSGVDNSVWALDAAGTNVYAGGRFTTAEAGGTNLPVNRVARWDGIRWSALGRGLNDDVWALARSGNDLYAGGSFTLATNGGSATVAVNRVARWNGTNWSALESGLDYVVFAIAIDGTNLYAGGLFTWATNSGNAVLVNGVAQWNGQRWSALGAGVSYGVSALAAKGGEVYAGGSFTTAGGSPASHVARWDGTRWKPLGGGLNGATRALAINGTNVYAAGDFTAATNNDGVPLPANRLARWNGTSWSALGTGLNNTVSALALSGREMFAGGDFTMTGGQVSAWVARAYLPDLPALAIRRSGLNAIVSWPVTDTAGFSLEQTGALADPTGWMTNAAPAASDGTNYSVTCPATNPAQCFRLHRR